MVAKENDVSDAKDERLIEGSTSAKRCDSSNLRHTTKTQTRRARMDHDPVRVEGNRQSLINNGPEREINVLPSTSDNPPGDQSLTRARPAARKNTRWYASGGTLLTDGSESFERGLNGTPSLNLALPP